MSYVFIILLSLFDIMTCNASAENINNVRKNLIKVTRQILQIEHEIMQSNHSNFLLSTQEASAVADIFHQKQRGNTLQNLKYAQELPPLLMALTSHSIDDLVKTLILVQTLESQLNEKYNKSFSQLKLVSINHSKIKENTHDFEEKKEKLSRLENDQENLLTQKYRLFFKSSQNPNLEKFAKEHNQANEDSSSQNFDDLVHQLQTLFISEAVIKSTSKLTLLLPVNGILNSSNQPNSNTHQTGQDLSLSFETFSNAQVISPIEASVVFTGFVPTFGQVVILKQDDFFCVMTGLGTIHCFLGDTLLPGEPIGRMPFVDKAIQTFKLRMELHKGGQHLDPRPYLSPS